MRIRICRPPKKPKPGARRVCFRAPTRCCRYPCCSAWLPRRIWHRCVLGGEQKGRPSGRPFRFGKQGDVSQLHFASCEAMIRKADYDRYAAALFAPVDARPHLLALYAFHHEIAKTAERVSQPIAGQIRLQWWREAVEELRI